MSVRRVVEPVLTMLDEIGPRPASNWARELLATTGEDGTPVREIQRAYLKTVVALCHPRDFTHHDETLVLLNEAAAVAERLYPRLSVLLAWYKAHAELLRYSELITYGVNPKIVTVELGSQFLTAADLAERTNSLHAGLAYSIAAELVLRGGKYDDAARLARCSVIQLGKALGTTDGRIQQRTRVNEVILKGGTVGITCILDLLFKRGELQDTLPND
jgi:hypothetical protein